MPFEESALIHSKLDERKRRAVNLHQSEGGQVRLALEPVNRGGGQPGMNQRRRPTNAPNAIAKPSAHSGHSPNRPTHQA